MSIIASAKDVVTLLRDAALFGLAVLLLVWPSTFNSMLVNAGFEEGSVVGFKWKAKLVESDQQLKDAQATIAALQLQNAKVTRALSETGDQISDVSLKTRIGHLKAESRGLETASAKVADAVRATIAANAPLVQKAQADVSDREDWSVVFGGDTSLAGAKYETKTVAPRIGIKRSSVYYRQGSFRSVTPSTTRSAADEILARAKARRPDAYVVYMPTWCPDAVEKTGYEECPDS